MSSKTKKWHTKSKSGCVKCRERRIRCDEGQPVCQNCSRAGSLESCIYPNRSGPSNHPARNTFQVAWSHEQPDATSSHSFQKKWHRKTRTGCLRCKQRRVKCDESVPSCSNCSRMESLCVYPDSNTPSRSTKDPPISSIPAQLHLAQLPDRNIGMAFEYFHLYILPMFQMCHPSDLWTSTLGYSIQTDDTMRQIALALGSQQWMLEKRMNDPIPWSWTCSDQSQVLYGHAICSLRNKLQTTAPVEAPTVVLCSILCVALECLRGSPKNVVVHLDNAVRIIAQTTQSGKQTSLTDMHDLVCLVQAMCASAWAYCAVPESTAHWAVRMRSMDFQRLCNLKFPRQHTVSSMDVHSIVLELICTLRQLMRPDAKPHDRSVLFDNMYRLRSRTSRVTSALVAEHADSASRGFLESKLIMTQLFLDSTLAGSRDVKAETQGFGKVLDLIESSLEEMKPAQQANSTTAAPYPFTLTSGAIHTIETIIRAQSGTLLEDRARKLLQKCPPREGLWTTGPRHQQ